MLPFTLIKELLLVHILRHVTLRIQYNLRLNTHVLLRLLTNQVHKRRSNARPTNLMLISSPLSLTKTGRITRPTFKCLRRMNNLNIASLLITRHRLLTRQTRIKSTTNNRTRRTNRNRQRHTRTLPCTSGPFRNFSRRLTIASEPDTTEVTATPTPEGVPVARLADLSGISSQSNAPSPY